VTSTKQRSSESQNTGSATLDKRHFNFSIWARWDLNPTPIGDVTIVSCEISFFLLSSTEKVLLDGKEHSEYRWCSIKEALQLLSWKENKEALEKLDTILKN